MEQFFSKWNNFSANGTIFEQFGTFVLKNEQKSAPAVQKFQPPSGMQFGSISKQKTTNFHVFRRILMKISCFWDFLGKTLAVWWPFRCLQKWRNSKKTRIPIEIATKKHKNEEFSVRIRMKKCTTPTPKRTFGLPDHPAGQLAALFRYSGKVFGIPRRSFAPSRPNLLIETSVSGVWREPQHHKVRGNGAFASLTHRRYEKPCFFVLKKSPARGNLHVLALLAVIFWRFFSCCVNFVNTGRENCRFWCIFC